MTQVFQEACALNSKERARLVSKLIAEDMPVLVADDKELAQREEDIRGKRVRHIEVFSVMQEARTLAGIGGVAPALKPRKT